MPLCTRFLISVTLPRPVSCSVPLICAQSQESPLHNAGECFFVLGVQAAHCKLLPITVHWLLGGFGQDKFINRLTKARFVLCLPGARVACVGSRHWFHLDFIPDRTDRKENQTRLSPSVCAGMGPSEVQAVPHQSIWAKPQLPVPSVDSALEQGGSVWAAGPLACKYLPAAFSLGSEAPAQPMFWKSWD